MNFKDSNLIKLFFCKIGIIRFDTKTLLNETKKFFLF